MTTLAAYPLAMVAMAVALWWGLTGLVFFLCRRDRRAFPVIFLLGLVSFGAAYAGLAWSAQQTSMAGLFCAFSCAMILWGFQELSFYLGYITGPRDKMCKPGCKGWRHFGHALEASLYHEILIILSLGLVALVSWDAPNKLGLYTFTLIWLCHESARINVFMGVRNVQADWVPAHLSVLRSFLREAPMNPFFPPSVMALTAGFLWLVSAAHGAPTGSPEAATFTFTASLAGLALLEHIFLVLPMPLGPLWRLFGAPGRTPGETQRSQS